jgi:hypothetical protein
MTDLKTSAIAAPDPKPGVRKSPPLVKGPIKCHKCQEKFPDAEHYLNHACMLAPPSGRSSLP